VLGPVLAGLLGAVAGAGVALAALGVSGRRVLGPWRAGTWSASPARTALAVGAALVAGAIAVAVTGWAAAGVVAARGAGAAPGAWRRRGHHRAEVARLEAVAAWTEMLRDTIAAAAGLEQAIAATAPIAPAPIAPAVQRLAAGVDVVRLADVLRRFAAEVDDGTADLVATALALAAEREARDLAPLLGQLAATARAEAQLRTRVWLDRARLRSSVRVIGGCVVAFAAGLAVLDGAYLAPYDEPAGQLVLVALALVTAGALGAMGRLGRLAAPERVLGVRGGEHHLGQVAS
jgi:hypothetical protein